MRKKKSLDYEKSFKKLSPLSKKELSKDLPNNLLNKKKTLFI